MRSKEVLIALIPALFASTALAFSLLANTWCESIVFPGSGNSNSNTTSFIPTLKFSVWYQQKIVVAELRGNRIAVQTQCLEYPNSVDIDAKWKTARAFSIIAPVIGGLVTLFAWTSPCVSFSQALWKQGGCLFLFTSLCQGLTLLFLGSNACVDNMLVFASGLLYPDTCKLDWGTKLNISSVILWFIAGALMMFILPVPKQQERPPPQTQTVTYTATEDADGTTAIHANVVKGNYVAGAEQQQQQQQAIEEPTSNV